jgi:hypothetical protein
MVFNNQEQILFKNIKMNDENRFEVINQINNIYVFGGTDIDRAIKKSHELLEEMSTKESNECEGYKNESFEIVLLSVFATDGKNGEVKKNPQIVEYFTSSKFKDIYLGIGLGSVGDDYDGELLNSMFGENFNGCPLSEDVVSSIVDYSFSGVSVLLKNVSIKFSDDILEKYDVSIPLMKNMLTGEYKLDILNISSKIPFCLTLKSEQIIDLMASNSVKISGINGEKNQVSTVWNLIETTKLPTTENAEAIANECNLYYNYFSFNKRLETLNYKTAILSRDTYTISVKTLLAEVLKIKVSETHCLFSFYESLVQKLNSLNTEVGSVHTQSLSDIEFEHFLQYGNMQFLSMSSCRRQTSSNSRQITRQISSSHQQQIHALQNTPLLHLPLLIRQINEPILLDNLSGIIQKSFATEGNNNNNIIMCLICCTKPVDILCLPCKHASLCEGCIRDVKCSVTCVVCRDPIDSITKITVGLDNCVTTKCPNIPNVIYYPCRHVVSCKKCSKERTECQYCKSQIEKKVNVFINYI